MVHVRRNFSEYRGFSVEEVVRAVEQHFCSNGNFVIPSSLCVLRKYAVEFQFLLRFLHNQLNAEYVQIQNVL